MSYSFGLGPLVPQRPPAVNPAAVETPLPPQAVTDTVPAVSPDPPSTDTLAGQESQYAALAQTTASAPWEAVSEGLFQNSGPPKVNNAELQQALGGIAAALKATMNDLPPGMGAEQIMEQMQELEAKLTALVSPSPATAPSEPAAAISAEQQAAEAPAASAAETPETPPAESQAPLSQEQNGALNTPPPSLETPPDLREQYDALLEMLRDKRIESLLNHLQGLPVIHRIQDMLEAQKR
ncbi:MAG: hypothetical protein ACO1RX_05725 [Candidatus Sericytochromatia bacterium]